MKKKVRKKEAPKKKATPDSMFGPRDRVLVTYRTKWFDLVDVPGIILRANRNSGYPFKIQLQDEDGKLINLGHDDDGGEPGSGPYMYCEHDCLRMVDKYVPKRLDGKVKEVWKIGESFMPKADFSMDQDDEDDRTGVTQEMVDKCVNKVMKVSAIINRCGVDWLVDGTENYMWLASWIDPVDE